MSKYWHEHTLFVTPPDRLIELMLFKTYLLKIKLNFLLEGQNITLDVLINNCYVKRYILWITLNYHI